MFVAVCVHAFEHLFAYTFPYVLTRVCTPVRVSLLGPAMIQKLIS